MSVPDYVIGVDGGGSTTISWLASLDTHREFHTIGTGAAGPSNFRAVGFETASANVVSAIDAAFSSAQISGCQVRAICLAMAGTDRTDDRQLWQNWANTQDFAVEKAIVTNDALPVIFAASPEGTGVALISGTGSLALGRNASGHIARAGGWGPLIGDEGSGYAIAIEGLRASARAADGRDESTSLLSAFCDALSVTQPQQIISKLYSQQFDRPRIASLASIVFEASLQHDQVAIAIIENAVCELAAIVSAVVMQLDTPANQLTLAATGGVLLNQSDFLEQIVRRLANQSIEFANTQRVPNPAAGAVQMSINSL